MRQPLYLTRSLQDPETALKPEALEALSAGQCPVFPEEPISGEDWAMVGVYNEEGTSTEHHVLLKKETTRFSAAMMYIPLSAKAVKEFRNVRREKLIQGFVAVGVTLPAFLFALYQFGKTDGDTFLGILAIVLGMACGGVGTYLFQTAGVENETLSRRTLNKLPGLRSFGFPNTDNLPFKGWAGKKEVQELLEKKRVKRWMPGEEEEKA